MKFDTTRIIFVLGEVTGSRREHWRCRPARDHCTRDEYVDAEGKAPEHESKQDNPEIFVPAMYLFYFT